MKKQTLRPANTICERRVGLKGLEESELNRLDEGLLNRFAINCKSDSDHHSHPLVENTATTVTRLLLQIETLLADFNRPHDISSRSLALQGLALLGEDILDLVRENAPAHGGVS